jgi:CubicO group peptidase (beta-lactamase class C family)
MHHAHMLKSIVVLFVVVSIGVSGVSIPVHSEQHTRSSPISSLSDTDSGFDAKISFFMRLARFPALSSCIIKDDEVVWSEGYGYYDLENHKQATPDTIYVIASVTKTVVGTALMQLYEQGLFDLEDDVNTVLPFELRNPNFPDDPITFRMLLSHTSSLNTNTQNEYYWFNFSGDPPYDFFPDPFLKEFLLPGGRYYTEDVWSTAYRPGQRAMYANVGFDLISYLVELISGEPFLDYCDAHIFLPLEMYNTSFNLSTVDITNVAIPYYYINKEYYTINELDFLFGEYTPPEIYWRARFYPAGGLYTTINDLSHFLIAHMNDGVYKDTQILEKETVDLMHAIQPDNAIGYGLAWMKKNVGLSLLTSGHGGDIHGVDTWMLYDDENDIGVIYFANGNPAYGLTPLIGSFAVELLLYTLFTKEQTISGSSFSFADTSNPLFIPVNLFQKMAR